ncbi:hypothetical protein M9Y10_036014 [Tritrichomonas musculus]|uniref:Uncharacterized protein n=1 Tax=Tritrichomonas musculus TaxID=1915356 RepID=A0ABR2GVV3_9EUKA
MLNLHVQMRSFKFASCIINYDDIILVSITVFPGDRKKRFSFAAEKIDEFFQFFTIKISEKTQKILIVFRKESFTLNDPIIASTTILGSKIPKILNNSLNTEVKTILIYEPFHRKGNNNISSDKRKVIGKLNIQFSLTKPDPKVDDQDKSLMTCKRNGKEYEKMPTCLENENLNYLI